MAGLESLQAPAAIAGQIVLKPHSLTRRDVSRRLLQGERQSAQLAGELSGGVPLRRFGILPVAPLEEERGRVLDGELGEIDRAENAQVLEVPGTRGDEDMALSGVGEER